MNSKYKGTIVQESLSDDRVLNDFEVVGFKVTKEEDSSARWHLVTVLATENNVRKLSKRLKPERWYAHFWNGDDVIAVFSNKLFRFKYSDKSTWKDAVDHGLSLGISKEQLDFLIEE